MEQHHLRISKMFTILIHLSFLLLIHLSTTITTTNATTTTLPYNPPDHILLDCGSSISTTSRDGRNWQPDTHSNYVPSNSNTISTPFEASTQDTSITDKIPYMTARIFTSQFTYTFSKVLSNGGGSKFVRLYFYPASYSTFNKSNSFFSVMANNYTLLSNFNAYYHTFNNTSSATLIKEYIINIHNDQELNITFLPSSNSYAFVNGIEIVSIPDKLYHRGENAEIKLVGDKIRSFHITNDTAFETIYRLNVGGTSIPVTGDTGMFRAWDQDDDYLFGASRGKTQQLDVTVEYTSDAPAYTAPEIVYTTVRFMDDDVSSIYNMTWLFQVDSGFYYLLRLHFCEVFLEIKEVGDRVFKIFINTQTAEEKADVIDWGNGPKVAVKRDYIVFVRDPDGRGSKQDLWLDMHPNVDIRPRFYNALLNGLEIFKLNSSNGSLAGPNPSPVFTPEARTVIEPKKSKSSLPLILSVAGGVILAIALVSFLIFWRRKKVRDWAASVPKSSWVPFSDKSRSTKSGGSGYALPSDLCRHFSFEEIRLATRNFDNKFVIGKGGFGNVYKGYINSDLVAIKRSNPESKQGAREFLTEIEFLSKLRHRHLVSLIGYCDENGEMILVYDYMSHGTLRDHLYKTKNPPLPLKQRLQICIGAAKGLHYLHTSAKHTIIHRDVKSTNILLDEKWVAKVSDFGLSKMGPVNGTDTHVSTVVKGTFGYMDPEYYKNQQLTEKSDVYSFGIVLLEVLSARPAIIPNLPREQVNIADWARFCHRKGVVNQILDPHLKDEIAQECLEKYVEIAFSCLKDKGIERPAMNDVVWSLEFALQLQEAAQERCSTNIDASDYTGSPSFPLIFHREASMTEDDDMFSRSGEAATSSQSKSSDTLTSSDGFKSENVFSEMLNPSGR